MDAIDICVPTPLRKTKDPDLSYVVQALEGVAAALKPGQLVILESTTYPGTTDEVALPMLTDGGLKVDGDFFLAFSPERVDPGNPTYLTRNIPKIVGGHGPSSTEAATLLYAQIVSTVVPVTSTRVAEMVKLLENTFRAVNIGLVNELAMMCHKLDIDVWEVIEAAKTKPFGFMPFYPGPGLGGHCIPIDPFYLSWKARQNGFECRFIELAGQVNSSMPDYVVERVADTLNNARKPTNGSRIHLYGVAYKKDVSDMRESPALDILEILTRRGAVASYTDPYVPTLKLAGRVPLAWQFVPLIGLVAIAIDVVLAATRPLRWARLGVAVLVTLLAFPIRIESVGVRQTNVDLIAQYLHTEAQRGDLIVVHPWFVGITFKHYYHGPVDWMTLPPIEDLTIHRYDILKLRMMSAEPLAPLHRAIQDALQSGHRVWLVGSVHFPPAGHLPPVLPPAPGLSTGWSDGPYAIGWALQTGYFLQTHAERFAVVRIPVDRPVNRFENVELLVVEGWRFYAQSHSIVNQFQCLELLKRDDIRLFHTEAPPPPPGFLKVGSWKPARGLLAA